MNQPDNNLDLTKALHTVVVEIEAAMLSEQKKNTAATLKTNKFIKVIAFIFFGFSVYLMTHAYSLTKNVEHLANDMVLMYEHFGKMADDMNEMTRSVVHMGKNIRTIPMMTAEMGLMVGNVNSMRGDVQAMTSDVITMDTNLETIAQGVHSMSGRFIHLNQSVEYMRHNVGKMSSPLKKMPFM